MMFISRPKTYASIVAGFSKVIDDLEAHVSRKAVEKADHEAAAKESLDMAAEAAKESSQAEATAKKLRELLAV